MDPEKEVVFVDGLRWWKPREGAPDFVKGNISIDPVKLTAFLREKKEFMNDKGYFSVDVKKSRNNEIYLQLNTYKKKPQTDDVSPEEIPW